MNNALINLENFDCIQKFKENALIDREIYVSLINKECIKIPLKNKESYAATKSEINFYKKLRNNEIKKYFSKPIRKVITHKGRGFTYELITDYDNSISKTLKYYLKKKNYLPNLIKEYNFLINLLIKNKISFEKRFHTNNIVVQMISFSKYRLVIIDYELVLFSKKPIQFLNSDINLFIDYNKFFDTKKSLNNKVKLD